MEYLRGDDVVQAFVQAPTLHGRHQLDGQSGLDIHDRDNLIELKMTNPNQTEHITVPNSSSKKLLERLKWLAASARPATRGALQSALR